MKGQDVDMGINEVFVPANSKAATTLTQFSNSRATVLNAIHNVSTKLDTYSIKTIDCSRIVGNGAFFTFENPFNKKITRYCTTTDVKAVRPTVDLTQNLTKNSKQHPTDISIIKISNDDIPKGTVELQTTGTIDSEFY